MYVQLKCMYNCVPPSGHLEIHSKHTSRNRTCMVIAGIESSNLCMMTIALSHKLFYWASVLLKNVFLIYVAVSWCNCCRLVSINPFHVGGGLLYLPQNCLIISNMLQLNEEFTSTWQAIVVLEGRGDSEYSYSYSSW